MKLNLTKVNENIATEHLRDAAKAVFKKKILKLGKKKKILKIKKKI